MIKPITGLGPHGERAASPSTLKISEAQAELIAARRYTIAIVLHTLNSDWSKQILAGAAATLGRHSAAIIEVVDCQFNGAQQNHDLKRLSALRPDAIISIPVGNADVAEAHAQVQASGAKLILLDNVPTGLMPGSGYSTLISADNFGLGAIAAELLAARIPARSIIGAIGYDADFFATNERELAFMRWMENNRPDIEVRQVRFRQKELAGKATEDLIKSCNHLEGCFVAWDEPAAGTLKTLDAFKMDIPVTTVDLGNEVAAALVSGHLVKGIAAQRPYDLGVAAAQAALLALIDQEMSPWISMPGIPVTLENILEAYQLVWHAPAPLEFRKAVRRS